MHPNPAFRTAERAKNLAFARDRGFGIVAVSASTGAPHMSHLPFLISDDGQTADLHLVRSNPIVRALKEGALAARIAVNGPDGYISPDWYGVEDQVPTWNYVAVHLTGTLELLPPETLRDVIDRQSAFFESRLAPKPAWASDKMPADVLDRFMRAIVPARFVIADVEGTWKLNQNKSDEARQRAADFTEAYGFGVEPMILAGMMRGA